MRSKFTKIEIIAVFLFAVSFIFLGVGLAFNVFFEEPEIKLLGDAEVVVSLGNKYKEAGAIAKLGDEDISKNIKIEGKIDENKLGEYKLEYSITNSFGNKKRKVERVVRIVDKTKPIIELSGKTKYVIDYGSVFKDPGYLAYDNYDGDLTKNVVVKGNVNTNKVGTYNINYSVLDSSNNSVKKSRTVKVVDDKKPVITLKGGKSITIKLNGSYSELGYSAYDEYDGDLTKKVYRNGKVNTSKAGVYEVVYNVSDSSGNSSSVSRTVQVGTRSDIDGDNYVMVSIKEQKLWYYKNKKLVLSSDVVTGTKGVYDTRVGTFRLVNKVKGTYLIGRDYKTWVDYWMLFDKKMQIGLHDATWRTSFGGNIYKTSGSHGCVNMPYINAKKLFYNIDIGTRVIVY